MCGADGHDSTQCNLQPASQEDQVLLHPPLSPWLVYLTDMMNQSLGALVRWISRWWTLLASCSSSYW